MLKQTVSFFRNRLILHAQIAAQVGEIILSMCTIGLLTHLTFLDGVPPIANGIRTPLSTARRLRTLVGL